MKKRWFNINLTVEIGEFYISLTTPDFTHENHRPSWFPYWETWQPDYRTFFFFNWFFHFTLAWQSETPKEGYKYGSDENESQSNSEAF